MIGRPIQEKLYEYLASSDGRMNPPAPAFNASSVRFDSMRAATSRSNAVMIHRDVRVFAPRGGRDLVEGIGVHHENVIGRRQTPKRAFRIRHFQARRRKIAALFCGIDIDDLVNLDS